MATKAPCPSCGESAFLVGFSTVENFVSTASSLSAEEPWSFCPSSHCSVVYFSPSASLHHHELRCTVFQKSTDPQRLVCYCFQHTALDLLDKPELESQIADACRAGRDRCAECNPQGRCCLGNVRVLLRRSSNTTADEPDCCGVSRSGDASR